MDDFDSVCNAIQALLDGGADRETLQRAVDDWCKTLSQEQWLAHVSRLLESPNLRWLELVDAQARVERGEWQGTANDTRH